MAYPQQTFPFQGLVPNLLPYINTVWVTNGVGDITGVIGNNVVNALGQYILQAIYNYQKAAIISGGGDVFITSPINYINITTPTSLSWDNANWFNEYYFQNATASDIPLAPGFVYFDSFGNANTIIPARTVVHIAKTTNDLWIALQIGNGGGSGDGKLHIDVVEEDFTVGDATTNPPIIEGQSSFSIQDTNIIPQSLLVFLSGQKLNKNRPNEAYAYLPVFSSVGVTVTFNQEVFNDMDFSYYYIKGEPTILPNPNFVGSIIHITKPDMPNGFDYNNSFLNGYFYQVFYNNVGGVMLYQGTDWDYIVGGGITMLDPNWNQLSAFDLYIFVSGVVTP